MGFSGRRKGKKREVEHRRRHVKRCEEYEMQLSLGKVIKKSMKCKLRGSLRFEVFRAVRVFWSSGL
jgi:hypothetical protein